jgi:hypothetical protein
MPENGKEGGLHERTDDEFRKVFSKKGEYFLMNCQGCVGNDTDVGDIKLSGLYNIPEMTRPGSHMLI